MLRTLLIVLALALSACTSAPPAPVAAPLKASGPASVSGIATLALWGDWESDLAPAYTQLAVLRLRAAHRLDAGKIAVTTAIAVQASADQARALLDKSRRGDAKSPTPLQRAQLAEAQRLITQIEGVLK